MQPILCIVGPTCSGKTAYALEIARRQPTEIISADSRQVFRFMDIGTAKPSKEFLQEIKHHFIDIVNPDEEYSAGLFGHQAALVVTEIQARGNTPLVVGGSGLYIRALIDGLHRAPGHDDRMRKRLEERIATEGVDALLHELQQLDPESAAGITMKHQRRIVRALEVLEATGIPLSQWKRDQEPRPFTAQLIGLQWERSALYQRINQRVDEMMKEGLLEEVEMLQSKGHTDALQSLNSPGYKELFGYLRGEHSLDRAVELIKQHTRNFAKRQETWFRKDERIEWVQR